MLKRIRLPDVPETDLFRAHLAAWEEFIRALGVTRSEETHDEDCKCGALACGQLRAFRKFYKLDKVLQAGRRQSRNLQRSIDSWVEEQNDQEIEDAHTLAIAVDKGDISLEIPF